MPKKYDYLIYDNKCKNKESFLNDILDSAKDLQESNFNESDLTVDSIRRKFSNSENKSDISSTIILNDNYTVTKIEAY